MRKTKLNRAIRDIDSCSTIHWK